jgi:hypothetical protein
MICPIPNELLVRYWAHDVSDDESEVIELHVFGCAECFEASSRVAAMAHALATVVPPIAIGRDIALAEARGVRQATNDILPGVATEAWLHPGTDLLVHRLVVDLADVEKVSVDVVALDGPPLVSFDDVPFEPSAGAVLIGCQRHFVEQFPPTVNVFIHRAHRTGRKSVDKYTIRHRIG